MPSWKKILQSGSAVHVLNITASSLPSSSQPNIIGYDTASGRFTYFSTSSLGNIRGTGVNQQITFWTGTNNITGSTKLTWDNTTLTISGDIAAGNLTVTDNTTLGDSIADTITINRAKFVVTASAGQYADVKFRFLTQSYKNHVLTYDEDTGQIYYFSSSLQETATTCNPPIPYVGISPSNYLCSGSTATLQAYNNNPNAPIGTLTYQWSASGAPILNATTSVYEPIITANTTFTVTMCDGVCCNSESVIVYVLPHNTITLSSAAGTDNQNVPVGTTITPITYTTTGATGAVVTNLPPGISGVWSAGSPDTFTISGTPNGTGVYPYTITMLGGCDGGVNTITGNIKVTGGQSGEFQIRGVVRYDNTAQTPLSNVVVRLLDSNASYTTNISAITNISGAYTMSFTTTDGTYYTTAISTKYWAGVNATDALRINQHFAGTAPLIGVRLKAADTNGNGAVNAGDALLATRRFSNLISNFSIGDWVSETAAISIITGTPTYTRDIKMLSVGDVNGSRVGSSLT